MAAGDGVRAAEPVDLGGLRALCEEQARWALANFGPETFVHRVPNLFAVVQMAVSLGRVAHSHLKQEQGIRKAADPARLDAHVRDGAEAAYSLAQVAHNYGISRPILAPGEFPYKAPGVLQLLGMIEEIGELAEAHLALEYMPTVAGLPPAAVDRVRAQIADAIGDIDIYKMDYTNRAGFDAPSILLVTCNEVFHRDWNASPSTGVPKSANPIPGD